MHLYLIDNGGEYSDYAIRAIVMSDAPIDWQSVADGMIAAVPELIARPRLDNVYLSFLTHSVRVAESDEYWWLNDDHLMEMFRAALPPGAVVMPYEEVPLCDTRVFGNGYKATPTQIKIVAGDAVALKPIT